MKKEIRKIIQLLEAAEESAGMTRANFGFSHEKLEVTASHFCEEFPAGASVHPTEYIKKKTDLYRKTWIISPIKEAIELLKARLARLEGKKK